MSHFSRHIAISGLHVEGYWIEAEREKQGLKINHVLRSEPLNPCLPFLDQLGWPPQLLRDRYLRLIQDPSQPPLPDEFEGNVEGTLGFPIPTEQQRSLLVRVENRRPDHTLVLALRGHPRGDVVQGMAPPLQPSEEASQPPFNFDDLRLALSL